MARRMTDLEFYTKIREQAARREAIEEAKEHYKSKHNGKSKEEIEAAEDINDKAKNLAHMEAKKKKLAEAWRDFKVDLKKTLLVETLLSIYKPAVPMYFVTEVGKVVDLDNVERGIVTDFVNEEGVEKLLRRFSTQNIFLAEMADFINDHYETMLESASKKDKDAMGVSSEDKEDFFKDLAMSAPDDVIENIKTRVSTSIDQFLGQNRAMHSMIQDICGGANEEIEKEPDETKQEHVRMKAKRAINEISMRNTNILAEMVGTFTKKVLTDDHLMREFVVDGKPNINYITEASVVFYTFLEMVNTLGLRNVDKEYIWEKIKEIGD